MKKYIFPTVTVVCLVIGFFIGNAISNRANAQMRFNLRMSKVDQMLQIIDQMYVEDIDTDSITDVVLNDFVQKLDPHSAYISKKDIEMVNSELGSSFSGIGVQFSIQQDTVCVVQVISGGPSQSAGVLAGDKIVEVDDTTFVGKTINNEKVMHKLRGEKGTKVKLGIVRQGADELLHYTITRGDIPVHSVDIAYMITPEIGFIRVNKFSETTYDEFMQGLTKLKNAGAKSYIVDLRENSGGYMDRAIKMANEFLPSGSGIVYSEGRSYPRFEANANGKGRFQKANLVVLIDNFSASASEIFAGAMQDNDRALIIGRRSFGKGLVQQQLPLIDGSAIRLTVARYYTPSGRCIQKPYELGKQEDYQKDLLERFEHGEMYSKDSISLSDSTVYYTKQNRVVYGGGGIMPDVFVGRDTTLNTPWYNQCVNRAITYQYAFKFTEKHRKELEKISKWQDMEKYLIKQNWLNDFVSFAEEKGVEPIQKEIAKSRPLLERLVNAYIVRNILGDEGFFPLFERDDEITKRAIYELNRAKTEPLIPGVVQFK